MLPFPQKVFFERRAAEQSSRTLDDDERIWTNDKISERRFRLKIFTADAGSRRLRRRPLAVIEHSAVSAALTDDDLPKDACGRPNTQCIAALPDSPDSDWTILNLPEDKSNPTFVDIEPYIGGYDLQARLGDLQLDLLLVTGTEKARQKEFRTFRTRERDLGKQ